MPQGIFKYDTAVPFPFPRMFVSSLWAGSVFHITLRLPNHQAQLAHIMDLTFKLALPLRHARF